MSKVNKKSFFAKTYLLATLSLLCMFAGFLMESLFLIENNYQKLINIMGIIFGLLAFLSVIHKDNIKEFNDFKNKHIN